MQELTDIELIAITISLTLNIILTMVFLVELYYFNKHSNKKQKPIKTIRFVDFRYLKMFDERIKKSLK